MTAWETVRYRDAGGVLRKIELQFGNELNLPGASLPSRIARTPADVRMYQKWVPEHTGKHDASIYDLLDAEIRAGTRLRQAYRSSRDSRQFSVLIGYNVDVAEPFALLEPYRGVPLAPRRLDLPELREIAISLLRALQQVADAGVVHEAVRLAALRWDSDTTSLQLVDFEHALRHGDVRRPITTIPDVSPEQTEGTGKADVRDDIWGAGIVLKQLATGPYATGAGAVPAQVQTLLQGVFADTAATRPHAVDLLARLGKTGFTSQAVNPDTALYPGRQLFDEITARKHGATLPPKHWATLPPSGASEPATRPVPVAKRSRMQTVAAVCGIVLLITVIVVLAVVSQ